MKTSFLIWTRRLRERRGARLHGATRVGEGIVESMDPVLPRPPPRIFPCSRAPLSPPPPFHFPRALLRFPPPGTVRRRPAGNRPPQRKGRDPVHSRPPCSPRLTPARPSSPIPGSCGLWMLTAFGSSASVRGAAGVDGVQGTGIHRQRGSRPRRGPPAVQLLDA
jgi:hypothetical protein